MVVQASLCLPLVAGSLRLLGFRSTQRLVGRCSTRVPRSQNDHNPSRALAAAKSVGIAARHAVFSKPNCLLESLTLWGMLRRQGLRSEIRIGVRKEGASIGAHAWVVFDGLVLNDTRDVEKVFSPIACTDGLSFEHPANGDVTKWGFRELR